MNAEIGPPKDLPDLMQGGYSCSTGIGMKRKRTGMSRGTFRTTTSTWSGRARRSTPVRGRRMSQKWRKENDNLNISWSLEKEEKVEELLVYQPHPGGDQCHVHHHHKGEVRGDRGRDQARQAEDGADQVCDDKPEEITFGSTSISTKPRDWKLVKKRGIIPDRLVQSKLKSFMLKLPNLERGVKRSSDDSSPNLGREADGVPNGFSNVV